MKAPLKNVSGLPIRQAARLANAPLWQVEQLARAGIIYCPEGEDGERLVSPALIALLPGLIREHFTPQGEFLENEPYVFGSRKSISIGGFHREKMRVIL